MLENRKPWERIGKHWKELENFFDPSFSVSIDMLDFITDTFHKTTH